MVDANSLHIVFCSPSKPSGGSPTPGIPFGSPERAARLWGFFSKAPDASSVAVGLRGLAIFLPPEKSLFKKKRFPEFCGKTYVAALRSQKAKLSRFRSPRSPT